MLIKEIRLLGFFWSDVERTSCVGYIYHYDSRRTSSIPSINVILAGIRIDLDFTAVQLFQHNFRGGSSILILVSE